MSFLRGLLFENMRLKFVALLLSVLVYLNARTDRPVTIVVSFPIWLVDLPDSLTLASPAPSLVEAEIRGTGKEVLRLRFSPPPIAISLAGVGPGHFERSLGAADLPLPPGLDVEGPLNPRMLVLQLDRRLQRRLPVAARVEWMQQAIVRPVERLAPDPPFVMVSGPAGVVSKLDSVQLGALRLDGKRDTVRAQVGTVGPERCTVQPPAVRVTVVLGRLPA